MANFDELQRAELCDALRSLLKARAERGEAGSKKAEGLFKRIDKLMNETPVPEEGLRGVVRDVYRYPVKYWTDTEKDKLTGIFGRYSEVSEPMLYDLMAGDGTEDEPEKKHSLTLEDFDSYLAEKGILLRYNSITRTYENGGITAADFTADCYSELVNRFNRVTFDVIDAYAARLSHQNAYNPVLEKLDGVTWDGIDRIAELCDIIRIDAADELSRTLVKKWCCQAVALAQNDGNAQLAGQGVLVLMGAQGAGKSTLCRKLAFDDATLYTDAKLKVDDRDSQARVTARWICELSELGRMFRSNDSDALKNFLTSTADSFRVPYGRRDESYPRRVNFIATLNPRGSDYRYLNDDGGDRRFWTVRCIIPDGVRFDFERENALDVCQLWRQAFEEVAERGRAAYELTDKELSELLKRNRQFTRPLPAEEELRDIIAQAETADENGRRRYKKVMQTATDIKANFDSLRGFGVKQIAAALDRLGFEQDWRRRYEFWSPIHSPTSVYAAMAEKDAEKA